MASKYLDFEGLTSYDSKIKEYVEITKVSKEDLIPDEDIEALFGGLSGEGEEDTSALEARIKEVSKSIIENSPIWVEEDWKPSNPIDVYEGNEDGSHLYVYELPEIPEEVEIRNYTLQNGEPYTYINITVSCQESINDTSAYSGNYIKYQYHPGFENIKDDSYYIFNDGYAGEWGDMIPSNAVFLWRTNNLPKKITVKKNINTYEEDTL